MGFAETRRLQDYRKPGSQSGQFFLGLETVFKGTEGQPAYPGGQFFNMAGMGKTEEEMKTLKTKEIKNGARSMQRLPSAHAHPTHALPLPAGRLAMIAMLGYFIQASFTGAGPIDNLLAHLSNPTGENILTTCVSRARVAEVHPAHND